MPVDLNELIVGIPKGIRSPQDVDARLEMDIALAMVVPWLLMHATAVNQPRARGTARPPAFRRPCLKGHGPNGHVKFDEMTWPVSLAYEG